MSCGSLKCKLVNLTYVLEVRDTMTYLNWRRAVCGITSETFDELLAITLKDDIQNI